MDGRTPYEYGGEFQFAAAMIAANDHDSISGARFKSVGVYLAKNADDSDDMNDALVVSAKLVPDSKIPEELLNR